MGSVITKVDIKINQDWTPVIDKYKKIQDMVLGAKTLKGTWIEGYQSNSYDFGANGRFVFYNAFTNAPYNGGVMAGDLVIKMLPWIDQFLRDTAKFDVQGIGIQYINGDMKKHVDDDNPGRISQCKLNYIIHDSDATTYCEDGQGGVEEYPSTAGTAWLIDVDKPHWVTNTGPRYILTIPFRNPFSEVSAWFKNQPQLIYGS